MLKLMPIIIASICLAGLSDVTSVVRYDRYHNREYIRKDHFFAIIMAIVMAVFVGLRTSYNDTATYIRSYEEADLPGGLLNGINWLRLGDNPGYVFIIRLFRNMDIMTQTYLMFYAVLTVCLFIWFIRKYSDHFTLSVYLFIAMGVYTFAMAGVKQALAMSLCAVATDRAINKKYIQFIVLILLAATFHPYALMYLIVPFFTFKPWTRTSYFLILITAIIGVSLQRLLGTMISITTMLGEDYDVESFTGEGVNIFRVVVVWVPVILSFVARKHIQKKDDTITNIMVNLTMVNAMIMFIGLFGTANYFGRLANYFLLFQTISLPMMLNAFEKRSKRFMLCMIVLGYAAYLYYAMGIQFGGFDAHYTYIKFFDYLKAVL